MRKRIPINPGPRSLKDVWQHFEFTRDNLIRMYKQARHSRSHNLGDFPPRFFAMDAQEIDECFRKDIEETDAQACLFLIAAAEAALRIDFLQRVYDKRRDDISREFRRIYIEKRNNSRLNIILDDDVLDIWAEKVPTSKSHMGNFKGALNYRHWLAHGRYWVPKLGRKYDPSGVRDIILYVFESIGLTED